MLAHFQARLARAARIPRELALRAIMVVALGSPALAEPALWKIQAP